MIKSKKMKNGITLILICFACTMLQAQNYKFGKVSIDEVRNNVYEKDTSASAVVLYKNRNTYSHYEAHEGWVIVTEMHKRIKILTKEGLDYATENISLFRTPKTHERISQIKGYTHNIVEGKLVSEKLKRSAIFDKKESKNWDETSFTMPNAKVGSVVEWTYIIKSPYNKIDDLIIQEDIPTKHYFGKIQAFTEYNYKRIAKGGYAFTPKEYREDRTLSTGSSMIKGVENVHEYDLRNIPALKEEPFVDNINNYRFLITYELQSTTFTSGTKQYSTTWAKVVEAINKSNDFGDQVKKTKYFRDDLETFVDQTEGKKKTLNRVFNYVRDKMSWNGKYGKYTNVGVQKAYKESTGEASEINLMLVAMLRESGIIANPVLVSTRRHGIPAFPTREGFNYVIACAEIGGEDILMDATEKNAIPGILPERVLNWEGTLVMSDNRFRKVRLYPTKASQKNTLLNVKISEDGSLIGKLSNSFSLLQALNYRSNFKDVNKNSYVEALLDAYQLDDISDFKSENIKDLDKNIKESFSFELDEGAEVIGSDIYFSPLFFLALDENPFKLEDRQYPINYTYPRVQRKIVNIKIPEGYKVSSLPKPIKMKLPDNLGSFLFNITEVEGGINVMSDFKINSAVIPSYGYGELKEFYNQRVLKETEKVVLSKL